MNEKEKNPFKEMAPTKEVPGKIKEDLMKNVTLLKELEEKTDSSEGEMDKMVNDLLKTNEEISPDK